jgi:O-antigen/teichoic acid export membrane protein
MDEVSGSRRVVPRLLSESAVYGLGGVASQALAILLVPIYARTLGAGGYGVVAIVTATLTLSTMLATLGLPQSFFRTYLSESDSDSARRHALAVALTLRLLVSLAFLLLFILAAPALTALLFDGSTTELPIVALIGPIVLFDTLNSVPLSLLRAQRRPRPYAVITFTRAVLGSVLIIGFVVVAGFGVLGVVLGSAVSAAVSVTMGFAVLRRAVPIRLAWDDALVRRMLAFSVPLVPGALAAWGLNASDRYIVNAVDGFAAAGVYASGYTAGLVITAIVVVPFTLTWGAAYWEIARGPDPERVISRVLTIFTVAAAGIALALSAIGTDAIRILLGDEFEAARFVVPFSAFGGVLYGAYAILTTGLNLVGKTGWMPVTMIAAAIGNVVLNVALVPTFGFIGAAIATIVSYGQLALTSALVSQRYYRVPWDVRRVLTALVVASALAGAALLGPDLLIWRLAMIAAYPLGLLATDTIRRADVAALREISSRAVGRRVA